MWATVPATAAGDFDEVGALWTADVLFQVYITTGAHRTTCIECKDHPQVNRRLIGCHLAKLHEDIDVAIATNIRVGGRLIPILGGNALSVMNLIVLVQAGLHGPGVVLGCFDIGISFGR